MPQLDPVLHHPLRTGPTRDSQRQSDAEPVYRQEPHCILPQRLPINMSSMMRTRPVAREGNGQQRNIPLSRVPVIVRRSNQRPQEAGSGPDRSVMDLSDPSMLHASSALPGMGFTLSGVSPVLAVALGVGLGLLACRMVVR
jgi:hypothetical protein